MSKPNVPCMRLTHFNTVNYIKHQCKGKTQKSYEDNEIKEAITFNTKIEFVEPLNFVYNNMINIRATGANLPCH